MCANSTCMAFRGLILTIFFLLAGKCFSAPVRSPPPQRSPPPPPPISRSPNPPSPPSEVLPLSPGNCNLVRIFNATNGQISPGLYLQSFRLTIRTSWSAIASNALSKEQFINDTRGALALTFQVRSYRSYFLSLSYGL